MKPKRSVYLMKPKAQRILDEAEAQRILDEAEAQRILDEAEAQRILDEEAARILAVINSCRHHDAVRPDNSGRYVYYRTGVKLRILALSSLHVPQRGCAVW